MRRSLLIALPFVVLLVVATGSAQAVVVDMNAVGRSSVAYNPSDQSGYFGVALVPGTRGKLLAAGVPTVTSNAPCLDPALPPEMTLPAYGLCAHGGPVMHGNETFAEVWDPSPHKDYAAPYVEQFLRDVADASHALTTPYAVTTQYTDAIGRAGNASVFGGGYDTSTGYPAQSCTPSGIWHYYFGPSGYTDAPNDTCLTDTQLRSELQAMIAQEGLVGRTQPGYTPLLVLMTPPGVETCIDAAAHLCSANSDPNAVPAQFCSYHSQVVDPASGKLFNYVVQPWTPQTACDEPDVPKLPTGVIDPVTARTDMGARLVSPLSQAQIAAIVNPGLNGWFALDGSEINDNGGCAPVGTQLDSVTVGASAQNPYLLQREFNNGGVIVNDPFALGCAPGVGLAPSFVVPSAVDQGDVVKFDGSKSPSTLLIARANYVWSFGDGTGAIGPSVLHSYATAGTYPVKLTVIDRGGNATTLTQTIAVLGANGQPAGSSSGLQVRLQLMPQSLRTVLRGGIVVRVSSNQAAAGIASVLISRADAKRARIKSGGGPAVVIGRGTVPAIKAGTVNLRLWLSPAVGAKLKRLRGVTLTIRLAVVASGGSQFATDTAGRY